MELRIKFSGPTAAAFADHTRFLDFEGAIRSGKTTMALWKVLKSAVEHPGIHWLVTRWSDHDLESKLKPAWRDVCAQAGVPLQWHAAEQYDELPNRSRVYLFGLKAGEETSRFAKLRGLTVAGIYIDQAEEVPLDVVLEAKSRLSQSGFPQQLILTPNPPPYDHWLCREFPEDNSRPQHRYLRVTLYDNAVNLDPAYIQSLEETFPPGDLRRRAYILGQRGLPVLGEPVYKGVFLPTVHKRSLTYDPTLPLYEGIDFGGRFPCVVWAQRPGGGLYLLGGLMGQNLALEDFVLALQQYRALWFPKPPIVLSCCDPSGETRNPQGFRDNAAQFLRDRGVAVISNLNSNAPDMRLGAIERIKAYMRRRLANQQEAFGIEAHEDRWLLLSADHQLPGSWLADGFEAGYVWDDRLRQVAFKPLRLPRKDGWYDHGQNCVEYLEINFGGGQPSALQDLRAASRAAQRELRLAQRDVDPYDARSKARRGRGGY